MIYHRYISLFIITPLGFMVDIIELDTMICKPTDISGRHHLVTIDCDSHEDAGVSPKHLGISRKFLIGYPNSLSFRDTLW